MKVGLDGLSPLQVVAGRMILGALALGLVLLLGRTAPPRSPHAWGHIGVVSLVLCVIPFSLFAWAGQDIPSGLSSIYNATTPLMTVAVTLVALRDERPHAAQIVGLLLGLSGVLIVLAPWQGLDLSGAVLAQLACLLATASYGFAFVYLRRFVSPLGLPAVSVATVQVGIGAVVLAVCTPVFAWQPIDLNPAVLASMIGLGVFGTGFAYIWNTNIVAGWGATAASTVTYLTPVVGVALGALLLGEQITGNQPVGAAVVIVGILTSRMRSRIVPPRATARPTSPAEAEGDTGLQGPPGPAEGLDRSSSLARAALSAARTPLPPAPGEHRHPSWAPGWATRWGRSTT